MKLKIKTNDGIVEKAIPDKDHLNSKIKYPMRVYKNKKKYNRKNKEKEIEKWD